MPDKDKKQAETDPLNYPSKDDIYNQEKHVPIDGQGEILDDNDPRIEKMGEELIGSDLDVPGAELDDSTEIIGEEDEENNYYSLSDNHEDSDDD